MPSRHAQVYWIARLRKDLAERKGLDRSTIESHVCVARVFLRYLAHRRIRVKSVTPTDLELYLRRQRQSYRSRHGRYPNSEIAWRSYYTAAIHQLLRVAQQEWPPAPDFTVHLGALCNALRQEGLSVSAIRGSFMCARRFLRHVTARGVRPQLASPEDVEDFLRAALRAYRRTVQAAPTKERRWQRRYRKAIHRLLECVQGEWPPPSPGKTLLERFMAHLVERGVKGLKVFNRPSRLFVDYLEKHNLDAANVQPADVAEFFRVALELSKRHGPNLVENPKAWKRTLRRTVYGEVDPIFWTKKERFLDSDGALKMKERQCPRPARIIRPA